MLFHIQLLTPYMYVCKGTCTYVYMYDEVSTSTYVYLWLCIHIHIYIHIYIYIHGKSNLCLDKKYNGRLGYVHTPQEYNHGPQARPGTVAR